MSRSFTYKDSGVDIEKADLFVKNIRAKSAGTGLKSFAALFDLSKYLAQCRRPYLVSSCDGVGTKLKVAQDAGIHSTVGVDLVAMNVNDVVCLGARPLFFLDYIACGSLTVETLTEVVRGIKKGLREAACGFLGGETAQMPGMYKRDEYDLAGFCVGIVDGDKIIDGSNIREGDTIIGFASSGLHSNGFSLVRKVLTRKEIRKQAQELLKPTRIYVQPVLSLLSTRSHQSSAIKGIAHITGGAFYSKATKILPGGLGMTIYKESWRKPRIFTYIQNKGRVKDAEMYSVFNMGIGMIVVVAPEKAKSIQRIISKYRVQNFVIGEIVKSKQKIAIV